MKSLIWELLFVWKEPQSLHRFEVGKLTYNVDDDKYRFSYLSDDLQGS